MYSHESVCITPDGRQFLSFSDLPPLSFLRLFQGINFMVFLVLAYEEVLQFLLRASKCF